jgi:transglutaminase-like putative cysteine protease
MHRWAHSSALSSHCSWPRFAGQGCAPATWILALLTIIGGLNVIDAYRGVAGQSPGTALLLTMMALKLLEVRARRDLRVLLLLFGFLLVVQFLFDKSALRTAFMTLLLFANLALLFDLTNVSGVKTLRWRLQRAGRIAGVITLQALPLALVLFLFFPRLNSPLWNLGIENEFAITGLQDWLEPGSVRDLVVSGEDALRVRFDRPPNIPVERMYWRGIVVWHTDGRRWTPAEPGEFSDSETRVQALGETLSYMVALEPTDQRWLIGLDMPTSIPGDARLSSDFQVLAARPVEDLRFYRMSSAFNYRTQGLSLFEEAAATALPEAMITPRMRALVDGWRADDASPEAIVQRALTHFNQQDFYYTLLPPDLGNNPMDAFLFDAKSGFCEHYAGSFALLMRIAGIPTRIVLGYLGGEYNPLSGDYLIRQSDAHAWNEVWLAERGWVRIDPTAYVDPARVDADSRLRAMGAGAPVRFRIDEHGIIGNLLHQAHLLADALNAGWRQWVVGFSR